jgi:hypothetical protein
MYKKNLSETEQIHIYKILRIETSTKKAVNIIGAIINC